MKYRNKSSYIKATGYLISLLFLYLTFKDTNINNVVNSWSVISPVYIVVGAGMTILFFIIRGMYQLNNLLYISRDISFLNSLTSIGIAQFYNVILPARMGEVVRVYFLSKRHKIKKTTLLSYILIEKLLDLFVVLALLLVVMIFLVQDNEDILETFVYFVGGITIVASLIALYLFYNKYILDLFSKIFPGKIFRVISSLNIDVLAGLKIFRAKKQVLKSGILLLISWVCIIVTYTVIAHPYIVLLGLPLYSGVVFMIFSALALSIPSAPAGIGIVHYGLYLAVYVLGGDDVVNNNIDLVAAFAISTHFFMILFDVLVGIGVMLFHKQTFKRATVFDE